MSDELVERPPHYQGLKDSLGIEVLDLIEATGWGYHLGNVVKYLFRHEYKGHPLQDLRKARFYLNRVIEKLEQEECGEEESERDEYGRVYRASPPIYLDADEPEEFLGAVVIPADERVPGSDGSLHRGYYDYDPNEMVGRCGICNAVLRYEDVIIHEDGLDICSMKCLKVYQTRKANR